MRDDSISARYEDFSPAAEDIIDRMKWTTEDVWTLMSRFIAAVGATERFAEFLADEAALQRGDGQ